MATSELQSVIDSYVQDAYSNARSLDGRDVELLIKERIPPALMRGVSANDVDNMFLESILKTYNIPKTFLLTDIGISLSRIEDIRDGLTVRENPSTDPHPLISAIKRHQEDSLNMGYRDFPNQDWSTLDSTRNTNHVKNKLIALKAINSNDEVSSLDDLLKKSNEFLKDFADMDKSTYKQIHSLDNEQLVNLFKRTGMVGADVNFNDFTNSEIDELKRIYRESAVRTILKVGMPAIKKQAPDFLDRPFLSEVNQDTLRKIIVSPTGELDIGTNNDYNRTFFGPVAPYTPQDEYLDLGRSNRIVDPEKRIELNTLRSNNLSRREREEDLLLERYRQRAFEDNEGKLLSTDSRFQELQRLSSDMPEHIKRDQATFLNFLIEKDPQFKNEEALKKFYKYIQKMNENYRNYSLIVSPDMFKLPLLSPEDIYNNSELALKLSLQDNYFNPKKIGGVSPEDLFKDRGLIYPPIIQGSDVKSLGVPELSSDGKKTRLDPDRERKMAWRNNTLLAGSLDKDGTTIIPEASLTFDPQTSHVGYIKSTYRGAQEQAAEALKLNAIARGFPVWSQHLLEPGKMSLQREAKNFKEMEADEAKKTDYLKKLEDFLKTGKLGRFYSQAATMLQPLAPLAPVAKTIGKGAGIGLGGLSASSAFQEAKAAGLGKAAESGSKKISNELLKRNPDLWKPMLAASMILPSNMEDSVNAAYGLLDLVNPTPITPIQAVKGYMSNMEKQADLKRESREQMYKPQWIKDIENSPSRRDREAAKIREQDKNIDEGIVRIRKLLGKNYE